MHVVQRAVGADFQHYAQRKLFTPIGIEPTDYYWARDRSGNTYGYAHLMMPPNDVAKLGLLMADDGNWGGTRVPSGDYVKQARTPSPANPCYRFLFWLGLPGCHEPLSGLPPDAYAMSGTGLQNNFIIPSLGLMVTWTGVFGNVSGQGAKGIIENTSELTHNFFRLLTRAIRDVRVPDPGLYVEAPPTDSTAADYIDPAIVAGTFGIGSDAYPGCNALECLGTPLQAPFSGWPPGCVLLACVGPDPRTPGIR